ncbi:LytR/AlgR family response regulator transcription factor [Pseudopedobacter beijingensis]|uniref:LytR/AlgR family response regulator transcription factor n=1 Tax=Pseudopedobacter beijingensis TaxID=1207056 RepID=A0ABW4IFI8_9SPHI
MIRKILIIEDEKPNADRLKRLLKLIEPDAEVLTVLESIADCIAWFTVSTENYPDVVMMDIRLSDGLSFEIFDKIQIKCPVIFTTAYDEYAVKAFKFNSVDYLLKPVEQDELQQAFDKLKSQSADRSVSSIENLLNFLKPRAYRTRFLLPYRDGYKTIQTAEVAFFQSEMKLTKARLYNGKDEIVPQTLEELEQELDPKQFFRANRQFIIHIEAIQYIHNHFNSKLKIDIKNNPEVEVLVSREKATLLKNWMDF